MNNNEICASCGMKKIEHAEFGNYDSKALDNYCKKFKKIKLQKTRLKRRISAYRNIGANFTYMLTSDFKNVFSPMMMKKKKLVNSKEGFGKDLDILIDICSEEECLELNMKLDCYQIDNK